MNGNLKTWRRWGILFMLAGSISMTHDTFSLDRLNPATNEITVVAVHPKADTVEQEIRLPGSLEPFEQTKLFSKATGFIEAIYVDIGDEVKKDQVLVKLTIPEMLPDLHKAEADVEAAVAKRHKAEADAELAKLTHVRLSNLQETEPGAIAQQDVDVAAAQVKVAQAMIQVGQAELQVAEAQVSRLKELMAYAEIRAPYDGVITKRFLDTGSLIESGNNQGTPALELMNVSKMRLVVDAPDAIVPLLHVGDSVTFAFDALPDQPFDGAITRMAGALKPDVRSMRVEIHYDNANGTLRPGMYAKVKISLQKIPNVLTLPATVLRPKSSAQGVFIVEQDTVHWVPVNVLIDDGAVVVVRGRLDRNSIVVESSAVSLDEGQNVNVQIKDGI